MRKVFFFFLFIIPAVLFGTKLFLQHVHDEKVAGITSERVLVSPISSITPKQSHLNEAVQGQLIGTKGSYGIVVLNLKTEEAYLFNEHRVYKTGSLYKLWVMATAFEQIKAGKLRESDVLSEDLGDLYRRFNLATPSASSGQGPSAQNVSQPSPSGDSSDGSNTITFTVADALEQMIIISDNNAALLLTERVGLPNIASFLERNGFVESKIGNSNGDPVTTPYDMALFLKKLYKGELADKEYTDKMITLLKRQRLNNKLPKYLPDGIVVAHKTGELDEVTHDVGIVYAPSGDYIISVLSESTSRSQAEERISNVSQAVYKYFEGQ